MLLPAAGMCPTTPVTAVGSNGLCAQDGPESLGNGATFSYWVSDVLSPGQQCAGRAVTVPSSSLNPQTIAQRCITALGHRRHRHPQRGQRARPGPGGELLGRGDFLGPGDHRPQSPLDRPERGHQCLRRHQWVTPRSATTPASTGTVLGPNATAQRQQQRQRRHRQQADRGPRPDRPTAADLRQHRHRQQRCPHRRPWIDRP